MPQPKAILHLNSLHKLRPSEELASDLRAFEAPKLHSQAVFAEGVLHFIRIANLSPTERAAYFGSELAGLHYNNDLAKLCNARRDEPIKSHQLSRICPPGWDYELKDGFFTLVFRGDNLSECLDRLLQGPTTIDCGMFCQLSIWFGLKYMLGSEVFNEVFGQSPFYLTQLVYNPVASVTSPYTGNPLFPFFRTIDEVEVARDTVSIAHVHNHKDYQLKHPGGNYGGDNCIVIDGQYVIFDPTLAATAGLSRADVQRVLLEAFNADPDANDRARLALYAEQDGASIHPKLGLPYTALIDAAKVFATVKADAIEVSSIDTSPQIVFDFNRFTTWLHRMQHPSLPAEPFSFLSEAELVVPAELVRKIPFENRARMSFSTFAVETPLQREMRALTERFCSDVMAGRSICTILTGKAGIGKTASAVSSAKELAGRGKRVVWISEVMVRGWADKATTTDELESCQTEVRRLLAANPDSVFLDDDNLVGYAGRVLLEEIYTWYTNTPGKGLFITSNEAVNLQQCFGLKLDKSYHFPPFVGYMSPQYLNTIRRTDLVGPSRRAGSSVEVMEQTEAERLATLGRCRSEASVGIVLSKSLFDTRRLEFVATTELVPAFQRDTFVPMRQSLMRGEGLGPAFAELTPEQQRYTKRFPINKKEWKGGGFQDTGIYWYTEINIKPFERTDKPYIAIELLDEIDWNGKEIIQGGSLAQLLRVINFAHDAGGKRIIILNNTKFSDKELIQKIKEGIPEREEERTISRLNAILFTDELLIEKNAAHVSEAQALLETTRAPVRHRDIFDDLSFGFSARLFDDAFYKMFQALPERKMITDPWDATRKTWENPSSVTSVSLFHRLDKDYLVEHRHDSPTLQHEYDKQFGLVLR